jgi:ubiquinone/menaquinone biosynthesis C-methylase UbiE
VQADAVIQRLPILRCPACGASHWSLRSGLDCLDCGRSYPVEHGVPSLIDAGSYTGDRPKISEWWDDLCKQWYVDLDQRLTPERLYGLFDEMEEMYQGMDHLVLDMDLPSLAGREVLDIGCGGGAQDALFRRYGANMSSVDISRERALSAAHKLGMVREGSGFAAQADGERLPFKDGVFDVVYSNGVMHHSESTEAMIAEAHRVLKPGGRIVMMLYAKVSVQYAMLLLYWGLARGYYFRYGPRYWLGACTEGAPKFGATRNPFTRAYTGAEIHTLFQRFGDVKIRKTECHLHAIPYFGRRARRLICRALGRKLYRDTFVLIEGRQDYAAYLGLERWLGPYLGWFANITARKPLQG